TGIARTGELQFPLIAEATGPAEPISHRPVWFGDSWIETPVYTRDDLKAGHAVTGPALIEENASVTVLAPGKSLTVDGYGNLLIVT
ncbi:MAG: N-methylhydantoinase, partial [Gammaproteobacteria bacterium]|nr:N-methylhydantoinase [Gammaproteobacteria bacterium]